MSAIHTNARALGTAFAIFGLMTSLRPARRDRRQLLEHERGRGRGEAPATLGGSTGARRKHRARLVSVCLNSETRVRVPFAKAGPVI